MDQSAADPLLDLRQLDGILTEIASIGQKHSLFENFIKTRLVTARPEESRRASLLLIEPNERVSRNMNELVTYFITMQDYYVKQSVQKVVILFCYR